MGQNDRAGSIWDLDLGEYVGHVVANCFLAQHKVVSYLSVAVSLSDHAEHLPLTVRQLRKGLGRHPRTRVREEVDETLRYAGGRKLLLRWLPTLSLVGFPVGPRL